jgi:lipopolysaccharide biosynthesis regulator YciM
LAQDYAKAGLFDRAETAWRALLATAYDTEARLALLSLYERSRDWSQAVDMAAALTRSGSGSFEVRIAHYHCERALDADAEGQTDEADAALAAARSAAPNAPRPLLLTGQRAAKAGRHAEALAAWQALRKGNPALFALVADDYAQVAMAAGQADQAAAEIAQAYAQVPRMELLQAMDRLDPTPSSERLLSHLNAQPSLGAAAAVLALDQSAWHADTRSALQAAVQRAARPLQRYRCAACGFEAHHYFWQCPGCQGWDTYPPRVLEQA